MAITKTALDSELQDYLASTQNIKADSSKRIRTLNIVLDKLQSFADWMFAIRKTTFDFLTDLKEYNISSYVGISDFKAPYLVNQLPLYDPRRFNSNAENIAYWMKDGTHFLSININKGTSLIIDGLSSVDSDGTWTASDDAVSLAKDENEYKEGNSSLAFNIDVSNSANDYATIYNSTKTVKDLSDYQNRGYFLLWVYLPTASITSIALSWGSDISNYYTASATAPVDGASFTTGWNRVMFKWNGATETGSPDVTAVDYYAIKFNYAATLTDQTNARINDLRLNDRYQIDFEYFSTYMAQNSVGTWQSRLTEDGTGESINCPIDMKPLIVEMAYYELLRKAKNIDKNERIETLSNITRLQQEAFTKYGYRPSKGIKRINMTR